ncbi:sulfate permease [Necator americanus]|uniref:Sulfate permease n=1 Tax=Necator americanus TaxID=51031 RepID=W2TTP4_NECAM|nr:sulfate permease [Necator americanus]ETN84422.1 sulfate permease [Necator americanus]
MPILDWLPKYKFKEDLISDAVGGFTTGVMHVPQGIAYSVLAGVDPVYGLYSSCFPAFFYMFFGTSRHASIGSFAVVALMAGVANDKVMQTRGGGSVELARNSTDSLFDVVTHYDVTPIQIATMLTFSIGVWQLSGQCFLERPISHPLHKIIHFFRFQILCALLRLQFVMTYFSDPLVSGFTTGAAVHVLLAQVDDIMGVRVPKVSGPGYLFVRVYDLAVRVPQVNYVALAVSFASMTFLFAGKEFLSPYLAKKFKLKLPIPYELILVAITAGLSTLFHWHENNSLEIVGDIPAGLPEPQLPTFSILKECLMQSIGIAIVIIAVHISMAKMLGKKFNYHVDDSQELYAIGLTSLLGGFFPVYPVSTALGRTMVNLSTVFSCAFLLAIILWLGPLLRDLPKCVLASIITVALKSMFSKYGELKRIYPVSKIDFIIWIVSFVCTAFIDVMEGLAISLLFGLFTVICRSQCPKWQYFFQTVEDQQNGEKTSDNPDICVFRFDGPLLFTNVERFKNSLKNTIDHWMARQEKKKSEESKRVGDSSDIRRPQNLHKKEELRFLIIDCSSIAYCDYMAANAFNELAKEFKDTGGILYIAGANGELRSALEASGFFKKVEKENVFPTLKDAIAIANRNGSALHLLTEAKKGQQMKQLNSPQPPSVTGTSSASLPTTPPSPTVRFNPSKQ